ncbi:MAG: hypothetical protein Q9188_003196 [Gyalolechia gomerana]
MSQISVTTFHASSTVLEQIVTKLKNAAMIWTTSFEKQGQELASVTERHSSLQRELDQSQSDRSSLREQLERANAETQGLEVRCGTLSQELADVLATKQQADHAGQDAAVKIAKERIESAGGSAR